MVDSATSISINWSSVTGTSGYRIFRSETSGMNPDEETPIVSLGENETSYIDDNLMAETLYYYIVVGYDEYPTGNERLGDFAFEQSATI